MGKKSKIYYFCFILLFLFIIVFIGCQMYTINTVQGQQSDIMFNDINNISLSMQYINQDIKDKTIAKKLNPYNYPRGLFIADLLQKPYFNMFVLDIENKNENSVIINIPGFDLIQTEENYHSLFYSKQKLINFWNNQDKIEKEIRDDMIGQINLTYIPEDSIEFRVRDKKRYCFIIQANTQFDLIKSYQVNMKIKINDEFKIIAFVFTNNSIN